MVSHDMRKVVCCAPGGWACPVPPRTGMVRWGIEVTGGRRMVRCLRSQGQGDQILLIAPLTLPTAFSASPFSFWAVPLA